MIGQLAALKHSFQYSVARDEVDAPGVVIERDDTRGAAPLGEKRVVAVPGTDIEHGTTPEVGKLRSSVTISAITDWPLVMTPLPRSIE